MIEVNNLIPQARALADFIQEMLNTNNYELVHSVLNKVEGIGLHDQGDYIPKEVEMHENLMSGATFTINTPNGDGIIKSDGNSLLHVALLVKVERNVIEELLNLGVNYSAETHVNSEGFTPVQYADKYFQDDYHVMDLRNTISGYYYEHTNKYDEYLTQLVTEAVQNNRIEDNEITIDIGARIKENEERSLFNSSAAIDDEILAFIDLSNRPEAGYYTRGTEITFWCDNNEDISLLAEHSN